MWLLRVLRVVAILTPFIPARLGYLLCRATATVFFLANGRARRNVLSNIQRVTPGTTCTMRYRLALRVCVTVVTNYYDLLRLRSVDRDSMPELIEIVGLEHVEHALQSGRGAIIVSAHLGNFSVMSRLPATLGLRAALIAERVEPPALYNYMARLRSAMGIEVFPPDSSSLRRVVALLRSNGVLLLAADRDLTGSGIPVVFFGEEATLPAGPVVLAMRTGASLIPAHTLRDRFDHSRVEIGGPIQLRSTGEWEDDLHHNVAIVARHLEQMIQQDPGQWAVLQRVWNPSSRYARSEGMGSADEALFGDRSTGPDPGPVNEP